MVEKVYAAAARIELSERKIPFEREKTLPVRYHGHLLCHHSIDLFVAEKLVVEIKSVEQLHAVHVAQTVCYIRLAGVRAGLLVNFNVPILREGIRRLVL